MSRALQRYGARVLLATAALVVSSCHSDRAVAPEAPVAPVAAVLSEAPAISTGCPADATKWVSAVNGSWLDAARWSAGVPTATVPACIDLPGSYVVTLGAAFAATEVPAEGIFIGDPGAATQPTLRVTQGTVIVDTDVTAHGRIELSPGTGASLTAAGAIRVAATGTLSGANTAGKLFAAGTIENDGTINAGTGLAIRATTIVNRGAMLVPTVGAAGALQVRGPASGGSPTFTLEGGSVTAVGALNQHGGTLVVRGGTVAGAVELHALEEVRLEHDGGGRFNVRPLAGIVGPTTTRLNGTVGAGQHVWMGTNHLTVETSGLVNRGQLSITASGALGKQGLVLRTAPGATIVNEGTITLNAASPYNLAPAVHGAITNAESGSIVNEGGTVAVIAPSPLINRGRLVAATSQIRILAQPDGTPPEVLLEDGTVESTAGRYQQTGGNLTVRGGTVDGRLDMIAVSELRLEHDAGGLFHLFALPGAVPATTSRLSGTVGAGQHVWMGSNHLTVETPGLVNRGQVTVSHVGAFQKTATTLRTAPGATLVNEGTLTLQSSPNSGPVLAGAITNAPGALLTSAGGHSVINPAPLTNRGTLRSTGGTMFVRAAVGGAAPEVVLDGGTLVLTTPYSQTGGQFRFHGGTVSGSGSSTFTGVRFSGFGTWGRTLGLPGTSALAPGRSPGRLAITGEYRPSSTTVTEIELAGDEPGTGYDQIAVSSVARFAGGLSVTLADGFRPRACQTFEIVEYASRTGTFAGATTPIDIGGGMKLRQVYTAKGLVLVAYNANGPNVSRTEVSVSMDGETDSYDVCVGAGSDVVTVTPDDQVRVDKSTLTFGASQLPQTVTVSAAPTATRSPGFITHSASSGTQVAGVRVLISGLVPADTDPPVTTAVADPPPNGSGWNTTNVTVALRATDAGSGVAAITWTLTGAQTGGATVAGSSASATVSAEGTTALTYYARDVAGNVEAPRTLTIRIDRTPPSLSCSASPDVIWPPNGKLVPVSITVAAGDAGAGLTGFVLERASSNEPGSDDIAGFVTGTADTEGLVRAARLGGGGGRVYRFEYRAFDAAGNSARAACEVRVPHDQGKRAK